MDREKHTSHGEDPMPRLEILANPKGGTSHATKLLHVEFDLFFDLWFVASLQLLAENKDISDLDDLKEYIGFLCILWFTWFSVCVFDVRFMTDSVFERIIRTVHFGAMVGFIVVLSHFDPYNQTEDKHHNPLRTLCLILMTLRLALVAQYCSVYRYYRDCDDSKKAFAAAAMTHFIAAVIYLGIAPRFDQRHNSKAHIVWYVVSAVEALLQLGLAWRFDVLKIEGPKLPQRLAALTVVILGEGVAKIGKNIFMIGEDDGQPWSRGTIGVCVSAVASSYFLFLTYFDLLRNRASIEGWCQLVYSPLHFLFHTSLLLYSIGSATFIQWWQAYITWDRLCVNITRTIEKAPESDFHFDSYPNISTAFSQYLSKEADRSLSNFPIKYAEQQKNLDKVFNTVTKIPDSYWESEESNSTITNFLEAIGEAFRVSILDTVFVQFGIAEYKNDKDRSKHRGPSIESADVDVDFWNDHDKIQLFKEQDLIIEDFATRARSVFIYVFVCVGVVLLSMTILHILTLKEYCWRPADYVRVGLFFSASLALGLVSIAAPMSTEFGVPLWCMPVICGIVFLLFLITHLRWPQRRKPRPSRLRLSSSASGPESKSLFDTSVYRFDAHDQGHEYSSNGSAEVGLPGNYMSQQSPEFNCPRWTGNEYNSTYI